jgi:hypothetical protein
MVAFFTAERANSAHPRFSATVLFLIQENSAGPSGKVGGGRGWRRRPDEGRSTSVGMRTVGAKGPAARVLVPVTEAKGISEHMQVLKRRRECVRMEFIGPRDLSV